MNKETIKQLIFIACYINFFLVVFISFVMIDEPKNVSEYLEKTAYTERGYAIFCGDGMNGHRMVRGIYHIYNKDGLFQTIVEGGYSSPYATENYFGSKYVCYYDITNPKNRYICYDSIIYDSKPVYKTKGYIVNTTKPALFPEAAGITICWKSREGKWKLIDQSISVCEYEKYKAIKKKWRPIEISVFKTQGGFLAQVVD